MDIFHDKHSRLQFCVPNTTVGEDYRNNGTPECGIIWWSSQFLNNESTFVDVGGFIGSYSVILANNCKQVHAFEPCNQNFDCLNISLCLNNAFNVTSHNVALGSKEDFGTLFHTETVSTLRTEVKDTSVSSELVQIKTLDSYNLKNVDFMKINVEGYELEVLKGASLTLLDNNFPPFLFKCNDTYKDEKTLLFNFIKGLGYNIHTVTGGTNIFLASDHFLRAKPEKKEESKKEEEVNGVYGIPSKFPLSELKEKYAKNEVEEFDWVCWHILSRHYRDKRKYQSSYKCAKQGLLLEVPEDKQYLFHEELGIVCYYLDKKEEGYLSCENVTLSFAPFSTRNYMLDNQKYYMNKLPLFGVTSIKYELPENYIPSSSSMIPYKDGYKFNLRAVNYSINMADGSYLIRDDNSVVRTRNFLFELNKEDIEEYKSVVELVDKSGIPLYPKNIVGVEDVRLFGNNEFFCTYLEVNDERIPQMCYCQYEDNGDITKVMPLKVKEKLECEKNWLPFFKDDELHFIYCFQPLKIYKLNRETGETTLVKEDKMSKLNIDSFRGSASPIAYRSGYLLLIHQVFHSSPRTYYHRFVWLDSEFTEMKYSDAFFFTKATIEYSLSICHGDEGLFVIFSERDNSSKIGILDYKVLDEMLFK